MAGRFFTAAALVAAAFASPVLALDNSTSSVDNSTASTFSYSSSTEEIANTPASDEYVTQVIPPPEPYGGARASAYRHGSAWLPWGSSLRPRLPQHATNGKSELGTPGAPRLPPWISGDGTPLPQGRPWGPRTCENTDPYKDPPHTGMTRSYDFTISKKIISPDGVNRSAIVINDAFPGPTIEANWGDWISVTVHNAMNEGTAVHWHGLLQKETQWLDGVPSVMQCPIAPGSSFTYRFRADLYGTSWYHSHYSAQAAGGLFGPMIIHGPHDNAEYDVDLGPVMLSDWYHADYYDIVKDVMAPASEGKLPPMSNNNLINGKMNYPCQSNDTTCTPNAGVSKFKFESGKTYRIRLINSGAEGMQKFSIDNHKMTIIANDFVPVVPYDVEVVTLGIGQRTDIIVKATGKSTDAVWMRSTLGKSAFSGGCNLLDGISPEAVAAIYYQNANTTAIPTTQSAVPESAINNCGNDPLSASVPYFRITPDPKPPVTKELDITFQSNGTHNLWFVNNQTFRANYNDPILLEANLGRLDQFKPEYNVINFGDNSSIRIVVYNHAFAGSHPFHYHGHNMHILAEGYGTWDGSIVNPQNPQRRDVHILHNSKPDGTPSYMVMQIEADNPGVWPFHCHVAWHMSGGLYVNAISYPKEIQKIKLPSTVAQTCRDWSAYTGQNVVEQIDSGL